MKAYGLMLKIYLTVILCGLMSCSKDSVVIEEPDELPDIPVTIDEIEVSEPGSIEIVLQKKGLTSTVKLKVSGKLNTEDLNTLSRMGAKESLKYLDLSDTYMYDENGNETDRFLGVRLVETLVISKHVSVIDGLGGNLADKYAEVKNVVIPDNVTEIASNCFRINKSIESLVLPEKLLCIGESAFEGCKNLKRLELPESLKYIGKRAFVKSGIEFISLEKNINHIERGLFNECLDLKELYINMITVPVLFEDYNYNVETVVLGKDVDSIREDALLYLNKLKSVYSYSEDVPKLIGYTPISEPFLSLRSNNVLLYVPKGCFVKYWDDQKFSSSFAALQEMK